MNPKDLADQFAKSLATKLAENTKASLPETWMFEEYINEQKQIILKSGILELFQVVSEIDASSRKIDIEFLKRRGYPEVHDEILKIKKLCHQFHEHTKS